MATNTQPTHDLSCLGPLGYTLKKVLEDLAKEERGPSETEHRLHAKARQAIGQALADAMFAEEDDKEVLELKGRMDHYNRWGQKWRMVVDEINGMDSLEVLAYNDHE